MSYIPLPNFFQDALIAVGRVVPPGTMPMVDAVLKDILSANPGAWLSLGTLGTLWVVSSAFVEVIEALDAAYEVNDNRPFWKIRPAGAGLAAVTAAFLICAIATMIVSPRLAMACQPDSSRAFALLWPTSTDHRHRFHRARGGDNLFPGAQSKATLPCYPARRGPFSRLLERTVLPAQNLFPLFRQLQPNLWNSGRSNGAHDWLYWAYFILLVEGN